MGKRYIKYEDPELKYKKSIYVALGRKKLKEEKDKKPPKVKQMKTIKIGPSHEYWRGNRSKRYTKEQSESLEKSSGIKQIYDILEANRKSMSSEEEFEVRKKIISTI